MKYFDDHNVAEYSPLIFTSILILFQRITTEHQTEIEAEVDFLTWTSQSMQTDLPADNMSSLIRRINCRIANYEPLTPLKSLRANYYGRFLDRRSL